MDAYTKGGSKPCFPIFSHGQNWFFLPKGSPLEYASIICSFISTNMWLLKPHNLLMKPQNLLMKPQNLLVKPQNLLVELKICWWNHKICWWNHKICWWNLSQRTNSALCCSLCSGGSEFVQLLRYFPGEDPLAEDYSIKDINSIAGVLKLYFRELPEPLFPFSLFDNFMSLVGRSSPQSEFEWMMDKINCSAIWVINNMFISFHKTLM